MNFFNQFISEKVTHALGWTIVHAVWQVTILALIMAIVLWFLKNKSAKLRYTIGCATLFLMLGISQVTFLYQFLNFKTVQNNNTAAATEITPTAPEECLTMAITTEANWSEKAVTILNDNIQLILTFWIIGFILFAIRLFGGLKYVSKLRNTALYTVDEKWKLIVENLANRIPIQKTVQLAESTMVKVPMVLGYFKPLILFPIGTLNHLNQKEVEAILAHELGHIFRNDYLVNILQSMVDVCFYFHPAAWWISNQIRIERENCCDDIALELTDCSLTYAKALVQIQEHSNATPMLAMAAAKDNKQLLNRIKRILNQPINKTHTMEKIITSCLLLLMIFGLTISASSPAESMDVEIIDFESKFEKVEPLEFLTSKLESVAIVASSLSNKVDTIPPNENSDNNIRIITRGNNNKSVIRQKSDDNDMHIVIEDGEVKELEIDGKKVDPADYDKHQDRIDFLIGKLPEIPPTPTKPSINGDNNVRIITRGNTNRSVIRQKSDDDNIQVVIKNGEIKKLVVDGKKINPADYDKYEDRVNIIIEELPEAPPVPPAPPRSGVSPVPPTPPTPPSPNNGNGLSFDEDNFDFEIHINGEKMDDLKTRTEAMHESIADLESYFPEINESTIQTMIPEMDSLFDFDSFVDKNKYPLSLSKIHRQYNDKVKQLRAEGKFADDIEELSRIYSRELQKELERLKMESRKHVDEQRASIQKWKDQLRLNIAEVDFNERLWQKTSENELLKDGLIDSIRNFKFQLKNDFMKVNGKKYKGPLFEKYLELYKEVSGKKLNGKFSYSWQNNG